MSSTAEAPRNVSTDLASGTTCAKIESSTTKNCAKMMMDSCASGDLSKVLSLLENSVDGTSTGDEPNEKSGSRDHNIAAEQDPKTGQSPLMVASKHGHLNICQVLLDAGAPWNAIDMYGQCAGNYATDAEHWDIVNLLVEHGTKSELILGASIRLSSGMEEQQSRQLADPSNDGANGNEQNVNNLSQGDISEQENLSVVPVSHEPCTKPDYLQHNVRYNAANTLLLDDDNDAVMMEWERPLMNAHASILTNNGTEGKRVLNIGFGLGIIDTALQAYKPCIHVIIEAHPLVYEKMIKDGWNTKESVKICFGRWQEELPKLIDEGFVFDGIFYDTYGEHFTDLEDFHVLMAKALSKPGGVYSFFNGLAPDNLFFHGVACNCVKIQLSYLGFETEFAQCDIQVDEKEWDEVRRKYWHGRNTYYLPIVTWRKEVP